MNYKICRIMQENFDVDTKGNVNFVKRDGDKVKKGAAIETPLEKGYVYACLYFYDEVAKEIEKLETTIRKVLEEVLVEMPKAEAPIMLIEVSNRIRAHIGDDSLDALIKTILAEQAKHIALMPEAQEWEKLEKIKEAIFTELLTDFSKLTFGKATSVGDYKSFTLSKDYVAQMTALQKKLLAPALRMVGFINQLKLSAFEIMPDWTVRYKPEYMSEEFDEKEEEIKVNIKKLMEKEIK